MSRKNKNWRAFVHQNPDPTPKQAWDAAWANQQSIFHARSMRELGEQVDALREALDQALTSMQDSGYQNDHVVIRAGREAMAKANGGPTPKQKKAKSCWACEGTGQAQIADHCQLCGGTGEWK